MRKVYGKAVGRFLLLILACAVLLCGSCANKNHVFTKHKNVVVLLYHTLLEGGAVPTENITIYTNAVKFESDIVTLLGLGYKPISLYDLYGNKADPLQRYFAITFDDGYLTNYEIAYPILLKYGCYADIFINTDNEYMEHHFSFAQAREMEESGYINIHSHFPVHENVEEYSGGDFTAGLKKSFDTLSENLGPRKYLFFAYPYGYYDEEKYEEAKRFGVALQFIQEYAFAGSDFIYRTSVSYDSDIEKLLESAFLN